MTREELAIMTGERVEDTDYTMNLVLKQLKPDFIKMAVKIRLNEVEEEIRILKEEGIIKAPNGIDNAYWNPKYTEEQEKNYYRSSALLYERNRLRSILYHS